MFPLCEQLWQAVRIRSGAERTQPRPLITADNLYLQTGFEVRRALWLPAAIGSDNAHRQPVQPHRRGVELEALRIGARHRLLLPGPALVRGRVQDDLCNFRYVRA